MITTNNLTWRIGNQFFVIACALAYAKKNGHEVTFPEKFRPLNKFLKTPLPITDINNSSYIALNELGFNYQPLPIITDMNAIITGYRQSHKYWWGNIEMIREAFEMTDKIKASCPDPFIIAGKDPVAIHFRFTDYLTLKQYHTCLTETDYYENAIKQFDSEKVVFTVFSDDKKKAFEYMSSLREKYGINYKIHENTTDYEDLYLMQLHPYHIVSNSTFSWWGAALSKTMKRVVMPHNWFGPAYTIEGWTADDLYLPNAIVL